MIDIRCCEGDWIGSSDGPVDYWYAERPHDLDEVRDVIVRQIAYLGKLLSGVEVA